MAKFVFLPRRKEGEDPKIFTERLLAWRFDRGWEAQGDWWDRILDNNMNHTETLDA